MPKRRGDTRVVVGGNAHDCSGAAVMLPEVNEEELVAGGGRGLLHLFEQVGRGAGRGAGRWAGTRSAACVYAVRLCSAASHGHTPAPIPRLPRPPLFCLQHVARAQLVESEEAVGHPRVLVIDEDEAAELQQVERLLKVREGARRNRMLQGPRASLLVLLLELVAVGGKSSLDCPRTQQQRLSPQLLVCAAGSRHQAAARL